MPCCFVYCIGKRMHLFHVAQEGVSILFVLFINLLKIHLVVHKSINKKEVILSFYETNICSGFFCQIIRPV